MKDAVAYVDEVGMSRRAEFYSGRGPKHGDLSHGMLAKFRELILADRGEAAAKAFVAMVASLGSAAATTFLLGLYELEGRGWEWPEGASVDREHDVSDRDPDTVRALGFATIAGSLGRTRESGQREDHAIRAAFLIEHGYTFDEKPGRWRRRKKGEPKVYPGNLWGSRA